MRRLVLALVLLLPGGPLAAQPAVVRSGEHADFSRLVVTLPEGRQWQIEQSDGIAVLSVSGAALRFDTSRVFDLIPKTRISGILENKDGRLTIGLTPGMEARSFALAGNVVVIDVTRAPVETETPEGSGWRRTWQRAYQAEDFLPRFWRNVVVPKVAGSGVTELPGPESPDPVPLPDIPMPDRRVAEAEQELLLQLGRAASQGLISVDTSKSLTPLPVEPGKPATDAGQNDQPSVGPDDSSAHIAMHSETVIDRDVVKGGPRTPATSVQCPSGDWFAVESWIDEGSPAEQISEGRRNLVGEFDRPDPEAVEALAQTYIALGFGAEARALLDGFDQHRPRAEALRFMARIVDDEQIGTDHAFSAMTECPGGVALWAVLAAEEPPDRDRIALSAIQMSFSAMPAGLRDTLGPRLVRRLSDVGAHDVAQSIRDAMARGRIEPGFPLAMADAELAAAKPDPATSEEIEQTLTPVIAHDGPDSVDALLLLVEEKLRDGVPVSDAIIENAQALAFELLPSPDGRRLQRAAILGLSSAGRFAEAFAELDAWPGESMPGLRAQTSDVVWRFVAAMPDETLFLLTTLAHLDAATDPALTRPARLAIADRLVSAGLSQPARALISVEEASAPDARLLLGRAALRDHDASAALAHLQGLPGEEAIALRAKAFSLIGEHARARSLYEQVAQPDPARREAWRSADWSGVAKLGTPAEREFVAAFVGPDQSEEDGPDLAESAGPLAQARALIDRSRSERETLKAVLEEFVPNVVE